MPKDYQPKKNNPYYLPAPLYRQMLWMIRDYDRMVAAYHGTIWNSPDPPDGQPRGENIGKPTEREGLKRAVLGDRIAAIEQAILIVPEIFRDAVWNNIQWQVPYPNHFYRGTYSKWRCRFIYTVAEKMYLI